jgi:two-component sensor histidine kinase
MVKKPAFTSVRSALVFVVILAMLPAFFIIIFTGIEFGNHLAVNLQNEAMRQVEAMAGVQNRISESTRQVMATLAAMIAHDTTKPEYLDDLLTDILKRNPEFLNITITDNKGIVKHSALLPPGVDLSDRLHIRTVLDKQTFTGGEFILGKVDDVPSFPFSYPIFVADGSLAGTITCTYMLSSYGPLFDQLRLEPDSFLGMVDHAGIRLFFHPPRGTNPIGHPIKDDVWQAMQEHGDSGTMLLKGSDGIQRFYAFRRLRLTPADQPYMYIVLAIPESAARLPSRLILGRNLILMLLSMLVALSISRVLGNLLVGRRVQALTLAAMRIQQGNFDQCSGLPDDGSELSMVGLAMDRMAAALKQSTCEQADAAQQIERSLLEKETLLKEIHHRVKNNLQLILSMISLQSTEYGSAEDFGRNLEGRVHAMALIHESLYELTDAGSLDMAEYIPRLVNLQLESRYGTRLPDVSMDLESLTLELDHAIPLALILNELLSNAFEHAGRDNTSIGIHLFTYAGMATLEVADSGSGLPPGFLPTSSESLGLRLVEALTTQIRGTLTWQNRDGALFSVCFSPEK